MLEGFRREDPPSVPQIAVPITVPNHCMEQGLKSSSPKQQAVGCLVLIAFYYLLRVGEYTKPQFVTRNGQKVRATRTVQFTVGNIGFWKGDKVLPTTSDLKTLLTATGATLKISNKKNGKMGDTIHQWHVTSKNCPVKALAHRVHHILANGGNNDTLLCDYWDGKKW